MVRLPHLGSKHARKLRPSASVPETHVEMSFIYANASTCCCSFLVNKQQSGLGERKVARGIYGRSFRIWASLRSLCRCRQHHRSSETRQETRSAFREKDFKVKQTHNDCTILRPIAPSTSSSKCLFGSCLPTCRVFSSCSLNLDSSCTESLYSLASLSMRFLHRMTFSELNTMQDQRHAPRQQLRWCANAH